MSIARTVIGANFGDEGKGLMTDFLVTENQSDLVIRFNGGAQAGHTVVTPDGRRHVFSHFGSGCFSGSATLLSRFFIVNPILFMGEYMELSSKFPASMEMKIDPRALVTTPFDMLINQLAETNRADSRHGSCGMGIGETIERSEKFMKLTVQDLQDEIGLRETLLEIRNKWVPLRKQQLKLGTEQDHILFSDGLIDNYISDVKFLLEQSTIITDIDAIKTASNPVFEGAQGLLLDQEHVYFPHVTRSNTGIKNMIVLASESDIREVEVYYMTRSYFTRHGAGPLHNELREPTFSKIVDETNFTNEWQGSLRFAHLDTNLLRKTIVDDLRQNGIGVRIKAKIAITCLDQIDETLPVYHDGKLVNIEPNETYDMGDQLARMLGMFGNHFKSFGPTRNDVVDYVEEVDRQIEKEIAKEAHEQSQRSRTAVSKRTVVRRSKAELKAKA